jgi:hypothetical protein
VALWLSSEQTGAPGLPRADRQADFIWQAGVVLITTITCVVVGYWLRIAQRKQA